MFVVVWQLLGGLLTSTHFIFIFWTTWLGVGSSFENLKQALPGKFAIILLKKCTLDHFRNWKSGIYVWREAPNVNKVCQCFWSLMSRIECRYCSITTAYLTGLFAIFILLHIWHSIMCVLVNFYQWGHFVVLIIKSLHLISGQSWIYLCQLYMFNTVIKHFYLTILLLSITVKPSVEFL